MICKFEIPFDQNLESLRELFKREKVNFHTENQPPKIYPLQQDDHYCEIEIADGKTIICLDYDELSKLPTTFISHLDTYRIQPPRLLDSPYDPFRDVMPKIKKKKRKKTNYRFAFFYVLFNAIGLLLYVYWTVIKQ
jgi:hypothetical protein